MYNIFYNLTKRNIAKAAMLAGLLFGGVNGGHASLEGVENFEKGKIVDHKIVANSFARIDTKESPVTPTSEGNNEVVINSGHTSDNDDKIVDGSFASIDTQESPVTPTSEGSGEVVINSGHTSDNDSTTGDPKIKSPTESPIANHDGGTHFLGSQVNSEDEGDAGNNNLNVLPVKQNTVLTTNNTNADVNAPNLDTISKQLIDELNQDTNYAYIKEIYPGMSEVLFADLKTVMIDKLKDDKDHKYLESLIDEDKLPNNDKFNLLNNTTKGRKKFYNIFNGFAALGKDTKWLAGLAKRGFNWAIWDRVKNFKLVQYGADLVLDNALYCCDVAIGSISAGCLTYMFLHAMSPVNPLFEMADKVYSTFFISLLNGAGRVSTAILTTLPINLMRFILWTGSGCFSTIKSGMKSVDAEMSSVLYDAGGSLKSLLSNLSVDLGKSFRDNLYQGGAELLSLLGGGLKLSSWLLSSFYQGGAGLLSLLGGGLKLSSLALSSLYQGGIGLLSLGSAASNATEIAQNYYEPLRNLSQVAQVCYNMTNDLYNNICPA